MFEKFSLKNLVIIFIIASGYNFFYLVPNQQITKAAPDAGLMVLFIYLFYQLVLERTNYSRLNTFIIWYVFYYLLLVVIQASIASFFYDQSVLDGLIVARNQFHYLLVFCLAIDFKQDKDIENFMGALSIVAVFLFYLALINYFGPTIFNHRWGDGQGIRSGVVRAYLPGMEIFVVVAIWQLNRLLNSKVLLKSALFFLFVVFAALLFRQTKMHIVATSFVCALMLLYHRRFGILTIGAGILVVVGLVTSIQTGNNIVFNIFTTAIENVIAPEDDERSTWDARLEQVDEAISVVEKTFLTGSGGIVLREVDDGSFTYKLHNIRRGMDLGYFVWIKFYGLPGVILMLTLYFYVIAMWFKAKNSDVLEGKYIADFALFHFIAIMISMLTIGYFTIPGPMALLCIALAVTLHKARERKYFYYH